jgi:5'-methylthioadenosine phosphorylase
LERVDPEAHRRVAWVLRQAGVRKIVASSTAGSLNRALWARDFAIASDILELHQTQYSLLPGRLEQMCSARQMICPTLAGMLERTAREIWPVGARVFGQASGLVAGHSWGPRFQTPAEALAYRAMGADFTNHSIAPEATAAREIGACFVNATYITASFADYFTPIERSMNLENVHEELIELGSRVSLRAIARARLGDECGCARQLAPWPEKYRPRPRSN